MKRREFIALAGGTVVAWPLAARAQQPALPVIGFLDSGTSGGLADSTRAYTQGLRESGYVDGQNVTIEYRWAEGNNDRLPELADDLVRRHVAVIVAGGNVAVLAAKARPPQFPLSFR